MEPLSSYRQMLTWFCVFPVNENTSKWKKFASISFCSYIFMGNMIGMITSVAYFVKSVSVDLENALSAIAQIVSGGSLAYGTILLLVMRHDIIMNFDNLSQIFNKYKNDESFRFLDQANIKCELISKVLFKYAMKAYAASLWMIVVICLSVCWLIKGEIDTNYLFHSFKSSFPWDQQTLNGYLAEAFFINLCSIAYVLSNWLFLALFVSHCLYHSAFNKMFRHSMRNFNNPGQSRNNKEFLRSLIEFHLSTKDWFSVSARIFSPFILIQLIASMVILSCSVFQLDMLFRHIDSEICTCFLTILVGFTNLFVFCYYGKLATESFENMNDYVYEANWLELPIELQKYFVLMIANTQIPLHYHGSGVAFLNLETFCAMIRAVISYYMMFKTLTE